MTNDKKRMQIKYTKLLGFLQLQKSDRIGQQYRLILLRQRKSAKKPARELRLVHENFKNNQRILKI
jgi:hypothetical protein